jgi:hypothetical protein
VRVRESRKVYSPRKGTTVQIQMKMLFQKGHFEAILGGARSPVPQEMICKETTCSS